jgi:hypothetical protein
MTAVRRWLRTTPVSLSKRCHCSIAQRLQNARRWPVSVAIACLSAMAAHGAILTKAAALSDTTAPTLHALSLSPATLDVSGGPGTMTVTATITDDLVGVAAYQTGGQAFTCSSWVNITHISFRSPSRNQSRVGSATRVDGDTYQFAVPIPQHAEHGTWTVETLGLYDCLGNARHLDQHNLQDGGFPTSFEVTSTGDVTPPSFTGLTIWPASVDVSSGPGTVMVAATITDSLVGVAAYEAGGQGFTCSSWVNITHVSFRSPSRSQSRVGSATRTSGDMYQFAVLIPQHAEHGTWTVETLGLYDCLGNARHFNQHDLQDAGFPTSFEVTSTGDVTPPSFTGLTISPASLDVSSGPGTVMVAATITDNLVGVAAYEAGGQGFTCSSWVNITHVSFRSPSRNQSSVGSATRASDDTYQFAVPIPQHAEHGTWNVETLGLYDCLGNARILNQPDLQGAGFPTSFNVGTFAVTPNTWDAPAEGGTEAITLTVPDGFGWTATTDADWLSVSPRPAPGAPRSR